jgi:hypothetical protein
MNKDRPEEVRGEATHHVQHCRAPKHDPADTTGRLAEIRQKRGDTLVGTLRKTYGPDFAPGVRSDTRLDTLRKRAGGESLSKILED